MRPEHIAHREPGACTPGEPCQTCQACRIRSTVTTSETFTRAQVADLIARSLEIGAVTGEQVGWDLAHAQVQAAIVAAGDVRAFSAQEVRRSEHRQRARREHDTAAVHPWRSDYHGGPILTDWDGTAWSGGE